MKRTFLLTAAVATALAGVAFQLHAADQPKGPPPAGARPDNPARPDGHAERPERPAPTDISGTVSSFNLGGRGNVEGLLLTVDGKLAQVNFPPDIGQLVSTSVALGDSVKASVIPEKGPPMGPPPDGAGPRGGDAAGRPPRPEGRDGGPNANGPGGDNPPPPGDAPTADHPVYHLVKLTTAKGQEISVPAPADRKTVHLDGTIKSVNYDRRGMPDGATLDSGEFIRIGPRDAAQLDLKIGGKLSVDGVTEPNPSNLKIIRATSINGAQIQGGPRDGGPRDGPPRDNQNPRDQRPPHGPKGDAANDHGAADQPREGRPQIHLPPVHPQ